MSIKWWERYLRTGIVLAICAALIVLYAVPVTFTSLLSNVSSLANFKALSWLNDLPKAVIGIVQGVLPPAILAIILALVPIIFRILVQLQGVPTGMAKELGVQKWYFSFLFIQVFLVVTITGGMLKFFTAIAEHPNQVLSSLATNLPQASNYFFNYLMVQVRIPFPSSPLRSPEGCHNGCKWLNLLENHSFVPPTRTLYRIDLTFANVMPRHSPTAHQLSCKLEHW